MNDEMWTGIETRVRKLIKMLMEPGLVKMKSAEENSKKVLEYKEVVRKKLKRLKSRIISIEEKMPSNDKLNKTFMDLSLQYNYLEIQTKKDQQMIKNTVSNVAETLDHLSEQFPSVVNQVSFMKKEIDQSKKDFLRIRNSLETTLQVNIEEFTQKTRESLKTNQDILEKVLMYEKNLENLSDSLCKLETKEAINWRTCAQNHESVENSLKLQKETEARLFQITENMKQHIAQSFQTIKEEEVKSKLQSKQEADLLKQSLLNSQENLMLKYFQFVLTDSKHQKKIQELKHRVKQKRAKSAASKDENLLNPEAGLDNLKSDDSLNDLLSSKEIKANELDGKLEKPVENENLEENEKVHSKSYSVPCSVSHVSKESEFRRTYSVIGLKYSQTPKNRIKKRPGDNKVMTGFKSENLMRFRNSSQNTPQNHSTLSKSFKSVKFFRNRKNHKSSDSSTIKAKSIIQLNPKSFSIKSSSNSRNSQFKGKLLLIPAGTGSITVNSSDSEQNSLSNQPDLFEEIESRFESIENKIFLLKNEVQQGLTKQIQEIELTLATYINENKDKLDSISSAINSDLKPWVLNSVSSTIDEALSKIRETNAQTSKLMEEKYSVIDFNLQQSVKEFNSYVLLKRREINDLANLVKSHEKTLKRNSEDIATVENDLNDITNGYDKLKEAMIAVNALLKQDEIDKKTLSLLAVKTHKSLNRKKQTLVNMEKTCVSCVNNVAQVLPAYKVACLAYNSSPVQVNDRLASRIEILDDQYELLASMPRSLTPIGNRGRSLTPELPKVKINGR